MLMFSCKHGRRFSNMFANNLSSIYTYKHTYLQATKKTDMKKKEKLFSNIRTYKHSNSFRVRERQERSKKYQAGTKFVENNYSCNQTFRLACCGDSKQVCVHVFKHII